MTPDDVELFTEHHELGLFTEQECLSAFMRADPTELHDSEWLAGRGMYIGTHSS